MNHPCLNMIQIFTKKLLAWFDIHGRKNLPWQQPKTPYRIFISEIMLQQTQVQTVIPYFEKFIHRFPSIVDLANANEDDVLSHWAGLGYYARARNLHKTARIIVSDYQGAFPENLELLKNLPGIGPSTAAAIASLAFHQPTPILDGNVKRVLARYFKVEEIIDHHSTEKKLFDYATQCMSKDRCGDYTQAIMDLGALCCTKSDPSCYICPVQEHCLAFQSNAVHRLPQRKKKPTRLTKKVRFLIIHRNNPTTNSPEIFLEKRPSQGIWGGLWCFPSLALTDSIEEFAINSLGVTMKHCEPFMQIKHSFTHYHLELHTTLIAAEPSNTNLRHPWFSQSQVERLGLPQPIKKMALDFFTRIKKNCDEP